ncbi:chromate resistance protein ChrB domain-containing protein [Chlamydiota bacterium]
MKNIVVIVLSCVLISSAFAETWSTWDTLELDNCASSWLIKRFVDDKAEFRFYPKGEFIAEGIPFDTPDAELRRRHGISTFGSIAAKYRIDDPAVKEISKLIHDIEVNYWAGEKNEEARNLDTEIKAIIDEKLTSHDTLKKVFTVFDQLYGEMQKKK